MVIEMNKFATIPGLIVLSIGLAGCVGLTPYTPGPNTVIATNTDTGIHPGPLADGHAAIAYDPDGCQGWIMDDGIEGYSGRRFDPKSGLPARCQQVFHMRLIHAKKAGLERPPSAGRRPGIQRKKAARRQLCTEPGV